MLRLLLSRTEEGEGNREGTEWGGLGVWGGVPTGIRPLGRDASTTPAYGRHVAGAGWSEAASARRREGRGKRAALSGWAEREVGRPSSACPLFFFLNFFSPKSLNKIFEAFAKLFSGWSK